MTPLKHIKLFESSEESNDAIYSRLVMMVHLGVLDLDDIKYVVDGEECTITTDLGNADFEWERDEVVEYTGESRCKTLSFFKKEIDDTTYSLCLAGLGRLYDPSEWSEVVVTSYVYVKSLTSTTKH